MITIAIEYVTNLQNEQITQPKRQLTSKEKATVTSVLCDGVNYVYYQGDEPIVEVIEEPIQE